MPLSAGSVYAVLGAKLQPGGFTAFDAAMKKSIASAAKGEEATAKSTAAMGKFGTVAKTGAAAGVLALAAATVVSVKQAANFEQAMADVQAVTKANSRDMKLMSNAALDLGAKTGVGATKAAGALAELAKGGLSTKQTIGALKGTIAMSQAGSMDLAEAANTVAQALNLFALKGEDASHVADAFATAANKTTADVGFFAQGLAQGGAAAKAAGLTFDQTTAALEIMAANGFKSGSDAGTSLKTALIQLAHPSKKAQEVTKQLGLEFFKSNGEMKSLSGISGMLQDKFDGLSRKQRLAAAATLVGTDGMRALLALYDQGPGKIRQFEQGLGKQGTATDVANAKMDNLKGSWQKMVAQLQTISIKVGTAMLPTLKSAADGVTRFFDSLNKGDLRATGFGRFLDEARSVVGPILGIFSTIARGAALALRAASNVPGFGAGFKVMAREAQLAADGIDAMRDAMDGFGKKKPKDVKVTARLADQVTPTLVRIAGTKLGPKVQRILGDDSSVRSKVAALKALGINGPTARFLAQTGSVDGAIAAIAGRSVTIPVNFKAQPFSSKPPGSASGHAADGKSMVSLVGEGGGPEWIGNQQDGWRKVTGPQLAGLGPDDYVIPTEPRYHGRALDLIASAFGLPAFAKGKKPTKKERRAQQDRRIQSAETQAGTAGTQMDTAQELQREKAFEKAKAKKIKLLELERTRLRGALKGAKGSRRTDLRAKLANVENDLARTRKSAYTPPEVADSVDTSKGTPLDQNMQRMIDGYDAKVALAELNDNPLDPATLKDNIAPLTEKAGYLQRALAAAQADPGRFGGPSVVASLARDLKSTRDQITDLNKAPSVTADQQAVNDQQYQRGLAAGQTSFIDRLTAATVQGAGPSLVFQSYVPPSPSEARRLADHVVSGVDFQGGRPASSQRIGV